MIRTLLSSAALALVALACNAPPESAATGDASRPEASSATPTPVELHGALRVEGTKLVDACGRPVQLRGVSHFWHTWEGKEHWNEAVAGWLRDDWRVSVIRAPLAAHPDVDGDYLTAPDSSLRQLRDLVEGAIAAGMYVIVDFHAHNRYPTEAREVLGAIARDYGDTPNVIYAIWNEPEGTQEPGGPEATWASIREYAREVIPAIREHDPDNVVVVPTPFYDQFPDVAAADRLTADYLGSPVDNIMYDVHAYAGQHKADVRDRAQAALDAGLPIIMTEVGRVGVDWGPQNKVDSASFDEWLAWIDANDISYTKWSLSTRDERSSSLRPGAAAEGGWTDADLTEEGKWNRAHFRETGEVFYAAEACEEAAGES